MSLQSKIHQPSWNSLVISPTTAVDVHSLCLYAGVDDIYFALKDRQHRLRMAHREGEIGSGGREKEGLGCK